MLDELIATVGSVMGSALTITRLCGTAGSSTPNVVHTSWLSQLVTVAISR